MFEILILLVVRHFFTIFEIYSGCTGSMILMFFLMDLLVTIYVVLFMLLCSLTERKSLAGHSAATISALQDATSAFLRMCTQRQNSSSGSSAVTDTIEGARVGERGPHSHLVELQPTIRAAFALQVSLEFVSVGNEFRLYGKYAQSM